MVFNKKTFNFIAKKSYTVKIVESVQFKKKRDYD